MPMEREAAMRDMQALIDEIRQASYAYYVLDNPIISDYQWDQAL